MHRGARWAVRVGVSFALAGYILTQKVDTAELRTAMSGVDLRYVLLAAMLYLLGQAISGGKWCVLGRSVGFERPLGTYVRFYFVGMFFNVFGPSTLGGDVVRALYLGDGRRPVQAASSVVFDRMSGLAVLMAMGAVALLAAPQYQFPWPLTAIVVAGGIALIVAWWTLPMLVCLLPTHNRMRRQVEHDLAPFWRDRAMLMRVMALSLVFHLSQVVMQWLLARAAGVHVPLAYCLVFHPLMAFLTALPVSVSGLGVREGIYLFFLGRIGVAEPVAVTIGLLWWLVTLVGGTAGGVVFLASGARLPRVRARRTEPAPTPVPDEAAARYLPGAMDEVATSGLPPA
ncbi:MAG TPA: lysylphosphatidylglycerol synthase transmembrane domain-containing protein [Candidatus Limnocylindria bacterium]|nr:lysylphosphatidylglycerol synthase transmembrane domain-containing protein [Candidatus Limnocylindria bacterium]